MFSTHQENEIWNELPDDQPPCSRRASESEQNHVRFSRNRSGRYGVLDSWNYRRVFDANRVEQGDIGASDAATLCEPNGRRSPHRNWVSSGFYERKSDPNWVLPEVSERKRHQNWVSSRISRWNFPFSRQNPKFPKENVPKPRNIGNSRKKLLLKLRFVENFRKKISPTT